jgi:hypothetical protein
MAGTHHVPAGEMLLERVAQAAGAVVAASEPFGGLFPSLLDRRSGRMLDTLPPPIPGQRTGDRSHLGCNLIHDEALLATLDALAATLGRPAYRHAVERYLARWATHCTDTGTGTRCRDASTRWIGIARSSCGPRPPA